MAQTTVNKAFQTLGLNDNVRHVKEFNSNSTTACVFLKEGIQINLVCIPFSNEINFVANSLSFPLKRTCGDVLMMKGSLSAKG